MKSMRVLLAVFFFCGVLHAAAPACFAEKNEVKKEIKKSQGSQLYLQRSETLNTVGLEGIDPAKKQNPFDPNRISDATEKKNASGKVVSLRNSHQRPSDYIEDTPLGAAT